MNAHDYAALLKLYLQSKGIELVCPLCGNRTWSVTEPIAPQKYNPDGGVMLGATSIIELPAVCTNCKYVVHFAWKAVVQGAGG